MSGRFQRGGRGGRVGARGFPMGGRSGGRPPQVTSIEQSQPKDLKEIKEQAPPKIYPDLDIEKAKELSSKQIELVNIRNRLVRSLRNSIYYMEEKDLNSTENQKQFQGQQPSLSERVSGFSKFDEIQRKLDSLDDPANELLNLNTQVSQIQPSKRKKGRNVNDNNNKQPNKYIKQEDGIKAEKYTNDQQKSTGLDNIQPDTVKSKNTKDRSQQLLQILILDQYNFPKELYSSKDARQSQRQQNSFVQALVEQMQVNESQQQGQQDLSQLIKQEQHFQQNVEVKNEQQEQVKNVDEEEILEDELDEEQFQEEDDYYQNEIFDDDEGYDEDYAGGGGEDEAWF